VIIRQSILLIYILLIMASAAPQMRGLLASQLKREVVVAGVLSLGAVILTKVFVKDARLKRYEEFYKNFDAEKEFERMRNAGAFRCAKPDAPEQDKKKKK